MREKKLFIVGCPILTRTRRKAADSLDERKATAVVEYLERLTGSLGVSGVTYLASDGKFVEHPVFHNDVNPVFLACWGAGAAAELDRSIECIQLQIAWPFEERTEQKFEIVSMPIGLGADLVERAGQLARKNRQLAVQMCRLMAGSAAQIFPAFAEANLAVSIALAMFLVARPEVVLADFLAVPETWKFLARFLRKEVGDYASRLILVPEEVKQPWAY